MNTLIDEAKERMTQCVKRLNTVLSSVRLHKADRSMVQNIEWMKGSRIGYVADITVDGGSIFVKPWDKSNISQLQAALSNTVFEFNVQIQNNLIICTLPLLTLERRNVLRKTLLEHKERAKVDLREIRRSIVKTLAEEQKSGILSEDSVKRMTKNLEALMQSKTQEIEQVILQKDAALCML